MSELYTAVVNLEISEISFCGNLHTAELYDKIYDLFLTKMEGQYNSEIEQYESLRRPLKILELDQEYSKLTS